MVHGEVVVVVVAGCLLRHQLARLEEQGLNRLRAWNELLDELERPLGHLHGDRTGTRPHDLLALLATIERVPSCLVERFLQSFEGPLARHCCRLTR